MKIDYLNKTWRDGEWHDNIGATIEPGEPMWPGATFRPVITIETKAVPLEALRYIDVHIGDRVYYYDPAEDRIVGFHHEGLRVEVGVVSEG